jgi:hypothetical protein
VSLVGGKLIPLALNPRPSPLNSPQQFTLHTLLRRHYNIRCIKSDTGIKKKILLFELYNPRHMKFYKLLFFSTCCCIFRGESNFKFKLETKIRINILGEVWFIDEEPMVENLLRLSF